MVAIDTTLLAKLLRMTDSQHDAEALAAIRKANELLRTQAATWPDVLEKPPERPLPPGHQRAAQYRDTFRQEALVLSSAAEEELQSSKVCSLVEVSHRKGL